jgi:hypothetical protein
MTRNGDQIDPVRRADRPHARVHDRVMHEALQRLEKMNGMAHMSCDLVIPGLREPRKLPQRRDLGNPRRLCRDRGETCRCPDRDELRRPPREPGSLWRHGQPLPRRREFRIRLAFRYKVIIISPFGQVSNDRYITHSRLTRIRVKKYGLTFGRFIHRYLHVTVPDSNGLALPLSAKSQVGNTRPRRH